MGFRKRMMFENGEERKCEKFMMKFGGEFEEKTDGKMMAQDAPLPPPGQLSAAALLAALLTAQHCSAPNSLDGFDEYSAVCSSKAVYHSAAGLCNVSAVQ